MKKVFMFLLLAVSSVAFSQTGKRFCDYDSTNSFADKDIILLSREGCAGSYNLNFADLRSGLNANYFYLPGNNIATGSLNIFRRGISGATPSTSTAMTVEDDTSTNIQILVPSDSYGRFLVGDPADVDAGFIRYSNSTDAWEFGTNSLQRMIIDDSGKVGIGITDPDEQLEITGRLHLGITTAPSVTTGKLYNQLGALYWNGGRIAFTNKENTFSEDIFVIDGIVIGIDASDGRIEFDDATTDEINILYANVGIGTSTPAEKLHVEWASGVDAGFFRGTTDTDITGTFMRSPDGTLWYTWVNDSGVFQSSTTKP